MKSELFISCAYRTPHRGPFGLPELRYKSYEYIILHNNSSLFGLGNFLSLIVFYLIQNEMTVRLPSKVQGQFVLLASYFHNADGGGILNVVARTGLETVPARMTILSCR